MKTNLIILNRILFTLTAVTFFPFISTAQLHVTTGNNVGIGTSTPANQLDVQSATPIIRAAISTGTTSYSAFSAADIAAAKSVVSLMGGSSMSGTLFGLSRAGLGQFYSNACPLAIGTGNAYDLTFGTNNTRQVTLKAGVGMGIGTTSPGYILTVNGQPGANGYTQFTNYSDAQLKTNIVDLDSSLSKILQLHPVQFNYNESYLNIYKDTVLPGDMAELQIVHKGFIAQEVKQIFPEMVGVDTVKGQAYCDLNLSNLQVYLVKAMQEQQKQIESLKEDLLAKTDELTNRLNSCCTIGDLRSTSTNATYAHQTDIKLTNAQSIVLEQNVPNPFAEQTSISYYLPDNTQKAQMLFYNSQGRLIQSVDLKEKGKGMVNVFASDLSNGIYTYTLVVDGKIIETRKMVKQ
ncbi:MAG: tail fiber domain-containing protein [Bacteroidia bacterium]